MTAQTKNNTTAVETKALGGIDKYLPNATQVAIEGNTYDVGVMKKSLHDDLDAATATGAAHAALHVATAHERDTRHAAQETLRLLKAWIVFEHGKAAATVFEDFGFAPPKTPKRTVKSKAQAVAQAAATRQARHTMGKQQKKGVKGAVGPNPPAAK